MFKLPSPSDVPWRLVGLIAALILVIAVPALVVRSCDKRHAASAQSRVDAGQKGALTESAADAVNTVGTAAARESASDDLTRSNEQEIRNAKGSNAPVDPAARDAGLRSLCQRAAYRGGERCRLLQPRP